MKKSVKSKEDLTMIKAWKEYYETVTKPGWKWMRKYWKGYLVFCFMLFVIQMVMLYWNEIKEKIRNKFSDQTEEES